MLNEILLLFGIRQNNFVLRETMSCRHAAMVASFSSQ